MPFSHFVYVSHILNNLYIYLKTFWLASLIYITVRLDNVVKIIPKQSLQLHFVLSLILTSGIFKPCHAVVSPEPYFESCVFDMCATGGETVALCQAIETYADMCAAAGVPIEWRTNTFCRESCFSLFVYREKIGS